MKYFFDRVIRVHCVSIEWIETIDRDDGREKLQEIKRRFDPSPIASTKGNNLARKVPEPCNCN